MKYLKYLFIAVIAVVLLTGAFSGGVVVGFVIPHQAQQSAPALPPVPTAIATLKPTRTPAANAQDTPAEPEPTETPGPTPTSAAPSDLKSLFAPFWEAWDLVHANYIDQPVDDLKLMRGAIQGMLAALGDKHTSYMDPEIYQANTEELQGDFQGIGATVDTTGEFLVIVAPIPGSPAEAAGLKPGDIIKAVDGEDVTGQDGMTVLKKVRGPAGSKVTLTIQRAGTADPFDVTITRAHINIPSVESKMLDNNIAYVRIITFGDKTTAELKTALKTLMAQKPVGLIVDLRYNGGGYLNTAIEVLSQFIKSPNVAMYEEYGNAQRRTFKVLPGGLATDIPLVVLVNEGTASASEITAGAIQDYARGKLVGVTTYGKGSVQTWIELKDKAGAVRITIARWLTPKEQKINGVGLKPDVEVPLTEEDLKANKDPQLDKAIELLLPK